MPDKRRRARRRGMTPSVPQTPQACIEASGSAAFWDDVPFDANPHESPEHRALWAQGWLRAQDEATGA